MRLTFPTAAGRAPRRLRAAAGAAARRRRAAARQDGHPSARAGHSARSAPGASAATGVPEPQRRTTPTRSAKAQPGNNAPLWRGVARRTPGTVNNLPARRGAAC